MASTPEPDIPEAQVVGPARRHLPLVWIVPIIAVVIGAWIVVHNVLSEGPTITLRFNDADGIEPGKTKIRYKNVDIGEVKTVAVAPDRKHVLVTAQLVKGTKDYLVSDTRFWVVRPRIAAGSVSGLSTLLSGAYIGVDVGSSIEAQSDFVGLEIPPIVTADLPGREFTLHGAEIGSLDVGAVVSFRRIAVGQVLAYQLDKDGKGVTFKIFVNAPYDQYVTQNTRFWHASGIDLSLDANGLKVETQSLVSLVEGGLAFQTPPDQAVGEPAAPDATFRLFASRDEAMQQPDSERRRFIVYFKDSLRGLGNGAPVDFHGIVAGEVRSIGVEYSATEGLFRFPVEIVIYPDRMRAHYVAGSPRPDTGDAANRVLVDRLVKSGMRAQLKSGNLLTGQLYIALDFYPEARHAVVDWSHSPPILPTINGGLAEIQDSVSSILKKVDQIPLEQLSAELIASLKNLNTTLADTDQLVARINTDLAPEVKATLAEARRSLHAAQATLNGDAPLAADLREALLQISRSAQAVGSLADYLERHPESLIRGKPAQAPPPSPEDKPR
jgi:paraquat-inducible protein B